MQQQTLRPTAIGNSWCGLDRPAEPNMSSRAHSFDFVTGRGFTSRYARKRASAIESPATSPVKISSQRTVSVPDRAANIGRWLRRIGELTSWHDLLSILIPFKHGKRHNSGDHLRSGCNRIMTTCCRAGDRTRKADQTQSSFQRRCLLFVELVQRSMTEVSSWETNTTLLYHSPRTAAQRGKHRTQ